MNTDLPIKSEYFIKRFTDLALKSGLSGFPKDPADQHILLKSVILSFGGGRSFSEKEINEKLTFWIKNLGRIEKLDFSTLRRRLVDTGYLTRNKDGSAYQVVSAAPKQGYFDVSVEQIDIAGVLHAAQADIERRKQAHLQKTNKPE